MIRLVLLLPLILPLLWIQACGEQSGTGPTQHSAQSTEQVPPDDSDYNLLTPLIPGVPGSPGNLIKSARNPNGDSELSLLMRQFVDDLREARTLAEAGKPVKKLYDGHRKMRCSWPTKPDDRNEKFDALAKAYLGAVRAFDENPGQATYNGIIVGCISCHTQSCGGPLDFIASMKWDESAVE